MYFDLIIGILIEFATATAQNGTRRPTSGGAVWKTSALLYHNELQKALRRQKVYSYYQNNRSYRMKADHKIK